MAELWQFKGCKVEKFMKKIVNPWFMIMGFFGWAKNGTIFSRTNGE